LGHSSANFFVTAVAAGTNSGKVALAANHLARALQPGLPAPIEEICEMRLFYSLAAVAAIVAVPAHAGKIRKFDRTAFQSLQARQSPTIIFVHASWCPICRAQEKTISKLIETPEYRNLTVLTIDYDTQKSLWLSFGAQKQSTLIGFHGRRETARLAYDADPGRVKAVLASTLR